MLAKKLAENYYKHSVDDALSLDALQESETAKDMRLNTQLNVFSAAILSTHKLNSLNAALFDEPLKTALNALKRVQLESVQQRLDFLARTYPVLKELAKNRLNDNISDDEYKALLAVLHNDYLNKTIMHKATNICKLIANRAADELICSNIQSLYRFSNQLNKQVSAAAPTLKTIFSKEQNQIYKSNLAILNDSFGGGLQSSRLYFLAGVSNSGKTTLAASLLVHFIRSNPDKKAAFISLEISALEMNKRFFAMAANIPLAAINAATRAQAKLFENQIQALSAAEAHLNKITLSDDASLANASRLISYVEELAAAAHKFIVIDNKDVIYSDESSSSAETAAFLGAVTKRLREIALEYNCVILVLSQANRSILDAIKLKDSPSQRHFAGSSAAYAQADGVFWIYKSDEGHFVSVSKSRDGYLIDKAQAVVISASMRVEAAPSNPISAMLI